MLLQLLAHAEPRSIGSIVDVAPAFAAWLQSPAEVRHAATRSRPAAHFLQQAADTDAVLLLLELSGRLPASQHALCPSLPFADPSRVFERSHLETLLPALLASTAAHPRVHSVWQALLRLLSAQLSTSSDAPPDAAVENLWSVACEGSLFTSSHERKFLGFKLFTMLLKVVHVSDVPGLFSPNFMRCLVNSLTNKETLLHESAAQCLSKLLAYVRSDAGAAAKTSVMTALQRFAGGRFDRLTHTGAIASLMEGLEPDNVDEYASSLFASFLTGLPVGQLGGLDVQPDAVDPVDAERGVAGRRVWAVEQLTGALACTLRKELG